MSRGLTSDQALQIMADQIEQLVQQGITNIRLVTEDDKVIMAYFVHGEDLEMKTADAKSVDSVDKLPNKT